MCEKVGLDDCNSITSRYRIIRKRLENLGYRQALPVEALSLVDILLGDLIKTTESLRHFKAIAQDKIEVSDHHHDFSADPYKCDNAKLVQECNKLHAELSECRDNHLKQTKDIKRKLNRLEAECSDLQLASSRNLKRIKDLEVESSNKSKRIQELLGKCCKPTISNSSLSSRRKTVFPLRKPMIDGDVLNQDLLKASAPLASLTKVKPEVFDLVAMADRKIASLNHEVIKLKGELEQQCDNVYTLKTQLAVKGKEINRLRKMLEGGRPYLAVSRDCSCQQAKTNCDQCNLSNRKIRNSEGAWDEVKVLQQVKSNLEQQLKEALEKQHDAMSQAMKLAERNEELEKELRDIDHIALAVEADCNSTVKENNRRVSQLQEKLESAMVKVNHLENDLLVEKRASQELRADLEACRLEKRNIQRALDSTSEEKKLLTDRINQLTMIEETLNAEIERLSRVNDTQKHEIVQLECVNDSLKKKMDSEGPQILNNTNSRSSKDKSDKNGKISKKKNGSKVQRRSLSPPVQEKRTSGTTELMRELIQEKDGKINDLQNMVDQLRKETDYCKEEMERLKKDSRSDNELWSQICDLKHQLNDKEMRVTELQREKRELCREKFELESRLQGCRNRSSPCKVCNECRSVGPCVCLSPPRESGGSKMLMSRLERERDTARSDIERLMEERDILREKLKMATEAHTYEQRRLRDNVRELESRLKEIERERQELLVVQGSRRTTIAGVEEQLEEAREELRRTKQELVSQRTQYFQLRALQDQTDQALGDVQSQLSQSEVELSKAIERNRCFEQQQLQLDSQIKELKQEINTLRSNMARLDQEKDKLLVELDNKTEQIASLEREIISKEQQTIATEQQLREIQHKYQICLDQSAEQERQLRSMQMEMENNQRQLAAASADRDNAAQENRRLQDDLAALTCEIRTLQRELETSRAESYDLKRQLQTYVSEVRRAEELLNRKENERTEMLNHFRSLSLEATVLENNNHSLESEAAEARGALQSARDRIVDLEREMGDKDCLIRGYETQITELTQNVASLETQVRQQSEQRARTEADLNAVRDLCVKLDQQKENLMKELGDRDAIKSQYESQISRLRAEQNIVQEQMNREHVTVDRMEALLDQARQESMECQTQNQELQNEMARMKQRICELQNKLSAESAELRRYQNQAAEYSKQISELRRQVTNERFDRARKEEENRRNFAESNTPPAVQSARFQQSPNPQDLSSTLTRYAQNTIQQDLRPLPVTPESPEPRRAPRLSPVNMYKDSVPSVEDHAIVQLRDPKNGETLHQTISVPGTGNLCVSTTLQEHDDRKDVQVKISEVESSGDLNPPVPPDSTGNSTRVEGIQEDMSDDIPQGKKKMSKKACGCGVDKNNLPNCPGVEEFRNSSVKKNDDEEKKGIGRFEKLRGKFKKKSKINVNEDSNFQEEIRQEEFVEPFVKLESDNLEMLQHTREDCVRLLTEMREQTRNLNDQMKMMNSDIKSQNLNIDETIYQNLPIAPGDKITYRRVETFGDDGEAGNREEVINEEFKPPRMSTPKGRVDFNDNILQDDEKIPVLITSKKETLFTRNSPSSGCQEVRRVKKSTVVLDNSVGRGGRGQKSKIPKRSSPSRVVETSDNSNHTEDAHLPEDTSIRLTRGSNKSPRRERSRSGHSGRRDPGDNRETLIFHSLPEHSHHSESSRAFPGTSGGSRHERTRCNREKCP